MFTRAFWLSAAERSIKTGAGALAVILGGEAVNLLVVDWRAAAGVTVGQMLFSLATSLAGTAIGDKGTPSFLRGGG